MIYPPINPRFYSYYAPFVEKMKRRESGGRNVNSRGQLIKAKTSSAAGIYQITNGTWKTIQRQLNRRLDRYNLDDNESAMHQLFNNYCDALSKAGISVNNTTLYCMHFKGSTNWIKTALSNPNLSINYAFSQKEIKANSWLLRLGTLGAVINNFAKTVNGPRINQLTRVAFNGGSSQDYNQNIDENDYPEQYELPPPPDRTITCKKDQTIQEFIDDNNILMNVDELINYLDNSKNILKFYNQKQKQENNNKVNKNLITNGTKVLVPLYQIAAPKSVYVVNQTIIENLKYNAFVEKEVRKLLNNPLYKRANNFFESNEAFEYGNLSKRANNLSVWVWSRAIDGDKGSHLLDITPFIIDINTNVSENGGNFTITLPTINYEDIKTSKKDYQNAFKMLKSYYSGTNFESKEFDIPLMWMKSDLYESFISKNSTHETVDYNSCDFKCDFKDDNDELGSIGKFLRRKPSFFNTILQKNDLIFIRFEKLQLDKTYSDFTNGEFKKISTQDIPNNVYDMIGLIDQVSIQTDGENSSQTVTIQGRDLSKLVIDDTIYNFIVGYGVQDKEQIIKNANPDKSTGRITIDVGEERINVGDGIMQDMEFNFFQTHSVDEWIVFILSQLTNTVIVNDNLFSSYKDRSLITSRQNSTNSDGNFQYKKTLASGIWQIIKICFDSEATKRRLADDSLSTNTGSLINMIRKYAQKPFFELNMDTYGDRYYFSVRKPPFTYESFKTNPCINIHDYDIIHESLDFDDEHYSMFQLDALGSFIEATDGQNLIVIPAVLFQQLRDIWGLRNLNIASNYLDFDMSVSNLTETNLEHLRQQQIQDLNWIIESHIYLPFTRKGSITIKGDRRIKRGMNIRNMGTGEVFYVDSVSNYASFSGEQTERYTTLSVSRGIVEKYIDVYFNLVKMDTLNNKDSYKENTENIKFLLSRKQFR